MPKPLRQIDEHSIGEFLNNAVTQNLLAYLGTQIDTITLVELCKRKSIEDTEYDRGLVAAFKLVLTQVKVFTAKREEMSHGDTAV